MRLRIYLSDSQAPLTRKWLKYSFKYMYIYSLVEGMKRDCLVLSNNSDGQGVREGMNIVFKREILSRFISWRYMFCVHKIKKRERRKENEEEKGGGKSTSRVPRDVFCLCTVGAASSANEMQLDPHRSTSRTRWTKAWNETFCSRITLDRISRYMQRISQDRRDE